MNSKFGIQLYSVRSALEEDFRGTLQKLALMGFKNLEMAFQFGDLSPEDLASFLDDLGLNVCGIYAIFENLLDDKSHLYDYARTLGCGYVTYGLGLPELMDDFSSCVAKSRQVCDIAKNKGLRVCYHTHEHEYDRVNGKYILDTLLEDVPELFFEPDTAYLQRRGIHVLEYMQKYAGRIPAIHLHDTLKNGEDAEIGHGVININEVFDFARSQDNAWVLYEQVQSKTSELNSAQISMNYVLNRILNEKG